MLEKEVRHAFDVLQDLLESEVHQDTIYRILFATDASAYREKPLAVVFPDKISQIATIVKWASRFKIPLIPRAAGTSLAGQVVGSGVVIDVSRHLNSILEINSEAHWVRVEPGVVLDELNKELKKYGLFFGPETSTANRCTMGGMVGNNSCGLHSLVYGSTRDHLLELEGVLSDGSEVLFKALTLAEFNNKLQLKSLEGDIYRQVFSLLSDKENRQRIVDEFPDPEIHRRNTGYAIDLLLDSEPFGGSQPFNMCKLLAGSEGTLAFITSIKLNLVALPPKHKAVLCVHLESVAQSLLANLIALKHHPSAIELMDNVILNLTKGNILQRQNRFFVQGDPGAMLMVELVDDNSQDIETRANDIIADLKANNLGYHFPLITDADVSKVWNLRKAGLGVLSNMPGDAKPVSVVEDTAVNVKKLPAFIAEFEAMMLAKGKSCVYHAHIATGELHLRPVLNLKEAADVVLFRQIATDTAHLVKKYRGSLSGEHGDGRLRGEFLPLMIGEANYQLIRQIKELWDPNSLFNPAKIVDTPAMNSSLRYTSPKVSVEDTTNFSWDESLGLLRAVERCNGSGDCRKTHRIGGTMCPSFMVTRNEKDSTRGRANILRDFLVNSTKKNPFDYKEIYEVMDLCLSCKACKSECPSSVDMTKLKAEFLQHYYQSNGVPFRATIIGYFPSIMALASKVSTLANWGMQNGKISKLVKQFVGFAPERTLPLLSKIPLQKWNFKRIPISSSKQVYLFADEFTNLNDAHIGIKAILLLERLGYEVIIPSHVESGRTCLSKGLVKKAKKVARNNVLALSHIISDTTPLIGIEPSAILTFRDEYPQLVGADLSEKAKSLALNSLMIEEFLQREMVCGNITKEMFSKEIVSIRFHGHCYQKSLTTTSSVKYILSFPENYEATEIPSGCCGMAGAFGYEKEHYDLSMKIGELVLFPEVRKTPKSVYLAASGTSCRHQIKDGTGREALHPIEILYQALV